MSASRSESENAIHRRCGNTLDISRRFASVLLMGLSRDPHDTPTHPQESVLISTRDGYAEVPFAIELHPQNAVIGYLTEHVEYAERTPEVEGDESLTVENDHVRRTRVQQSDVISIDSVGSYSDRWYGQELTIYYGSGLTPSEPEFEAMRRYVKQDLFTELGGGQARVITPRNRKRFFDVLMIDGEKVHCLDVDLALGEVETYIDFNGSDVQIEARKMTKYNVDVNGVDTTIHYRDGVPDRVLDALASVLEAKFSVKDGASDGEVEGGSEVDSPPEGEGGDGDEVAPGSDVDVQSSVREIAPPADAPADSDGGVPESTNSV